MLTIGISAVIAAVLGGLAVKYALDYSRAEGQITWLEFAIGTAAIVVLVVPLSVYTGWKAAKANNLSFNEYHNGWERSAVAQKIQCTRDGPCRYEYDCDPYIVIVSYECGHYEGTGQNSHYVSQTCHRPETRYHSCPYVDVETDYSVQTTLGGYEIASHRLPDNPQAHRWREGVEVPGHVINTAGTGDPPFWLAVKTRTESGKPGPVTKRFCYDNYILASDKTILQQYSGQIGEYSRQGLLPNPQSGIYDFYAANKAYFVGYRPQNAALWQKKLEYLNAAFGSELQGDLHLVIVQDDRVSANPDAYLLALKAHWQNPKAFAKDSISKNSVIAVVGTADGKTVSWARAITGMPLGNERMLAAMRDSLKGASLEPDEFIQGALKRVLWGLADPVTKFKRVHMTNKNGKGGGFEYLSNEIELTRGQRIGIFFAALVASMLVWLVAAFAGDPRWMNGWKPVPRWRKTYR